MASTRKCTIHFYNTHEKGGKTRLTNSTTLIKGKKIVKENIKIFYMREEKGSPFSKISFCFEELARTI